MAKIAPWRTLCLRPPQKNAASLAPPLKFRTNRRKLPPVYIECAAGLTRLISPGSKCSVETKRRFNKTRSFPLPLREGADESDSERGGRGRGHSYKKRLPLSRHSATLRVRPLPQGEREQRRASRAVFYDR